LILVVLILDTKKMTTKRSALGKGLSALLENVPSEQNGDAVAPVLAGSITAIKLTQIETNPFQPRVEFDETALKELAESIRQQGIIQPITVRKMGPERYQIISGERRFRASKLAGLDSIPAYVRIANDQNMLEMALVENIQRENLNSLEVAISYQRLIEECTISQEELAIKVGKDRTTVTNYLRLLKLPPQIQFAIRDNRITMGHARAIIAVNDVAMQLKIFNDIISQDLSVRKVEELVREHAPKKSTASKPASATEIEIKKIQDRLSRRFETKTEIKHRTNGSGQLIFSYFSKDDLNRLLELLDIE
jgi:ParB family transcriptional regulator, chromosome partitioning protein